jgi:hypothetical protein
LVLMWRKKINNRWSSNSGTIMVLNEINELTNHTGIDYGIIVQEEYEVWRIEITGVCDGPVPTGSDSEVLL